MSNIHLKPMVMIVGICITIIGLNRCVLAQTYFPLGIWNYDVTGPEYRVWYNNEMNLIRNINATYLAQMSYHAQEAMIDSCTTRFAGTVRTELVHDTTGGHYPIPGEPNNPTFWRYISNNQFVTNIDSAHVLQFVNNVASCYDYMNDPGLGAIRVAHQGYMDQADHWPYIQYACSLINVNPNFGGYVQSVAVHNVFHWNDGDTTSLENFFRQVDSLDVYQHEYYPFYVSNQTGYPYTRAAYFGNAFQTNIIDQRLLASYDQTRRALTRSGNHHTNLEIILQTHSEFTTDHNTYFRRPTEAEIWLQAFLALGRGYKGVHTYVYRTNPWTGQMAYFDSGLVASPTPPTARTAINPYFDRVAQLYQHLAELGDDILPLTVLDAFTWTGSAPPDYPLIQEITGYALDGNHHTIEVSLMDHPSNNYDYFLLVNRRCSSDNNGTPAPAQTITVRTNKSGQYQIRDLYSGELFVTSNGYFRNITIGPGRGRLFELRPMFAANETWDTDTVNVSSSITVPSGRTLTIAPNSKVKFYSSTELKIYGTLNANGAIFTAALANANPGYWSRIMFDYASPNSIIQNSLIEKANYAIFCNASKPTIYHNTITQNSYGIFCQYSSHPYINDNYITDNGNYGIYLTQTCNPYLRHNAISNNGVYGVLCLNSSSPSLIGKSSSEPYGANEIIANESHGVRAQTNSNPNLGTATSGSLQGYNDIYSNGGKQVSNYTAGITIMAKRNWWGTPNPGSGLFYGSVNYTSPLSEPSPYAGPTWGGESLSSPPVVEDDITDEVEKYLAQGQMFEGEEKYQEAVEAYRYVIDNFSESEYCSFAFSRLMACRDKQGDITVEKDYVEALSHKGTTNEAAISALLWQPLIEARAKNDQLALELCDQLIKSYAGSDLAHDAWFEKGSIQLYEMNDVEAAKKTFAEFAQAYPNDPLVEHIDIIISAYTPTPTTLPKPLVQDNDQPSDFMIPEQFALAQNHPNPFNPETEIHYQLPEATHVTLAIYNLLGQKIRSLIDEQQASGVYAVHWDGRDENGSPVASGVYLYAINAGEFRQVRKMMLVR